jgi:hypothetical protein
MKMKRAISLWLLALILVISLTGCDLSQGGTITIKNDTRKNVSGSYTMVTREKVNDSYTDVNSSGSWSLAAGESWSKSIDGDGKYSVSFPSYDDDNGQYHNGEEKSGSLTGGEEVTLYVSSYVPGLEPYADYVQFKNDNPVPVTVYSDLAHQNKIANVAARGTSSYLTNLSYYNRNAETHLYLVYHLFGAAEFPYSYDFVDFVNIVSETLLPILDHLTAEVKSRVLTNDVYIIVQNTSSLSLILTSGANEIPPLGSSSSVLGSGNTGGYRVNAGSASSYWFKQSGIDRIDFPSGLSDFSNSTLYAISYSGSSLSSWALGSYSSSVFIISVDGALRYERRDAAYER